MMKTSVWWDINSCPIPDGYDARRVRPCIESALEKLGYSGPLTIFAMGNLKRTPYHVLRALASTGIVVNYITCGLESICTNMRDWTNDNPPPARIMFIFNANANSRVVKSLSLSLYKLQVSGFNILLAYSETPKQALVASAEWLWKSLLQGHPLQDKCSETAESSCFVCTLCDFSCQSLEDLTTHLKGEEHEVQEFEPEVLDLTMDKDYLEMMGEARVYTTTMVKKKQLKRKLKNKVVKAGVVDSSSVKKKLSKRRKKLNRRRTE